MNKETLEFIDGLLQTALELFAEEGRQDIHYTELSDAYYGKPVSGESYQAVKSRLKQIRERLELEDVFTVLVSRDYYGLNRAYDKKTTTQIPRPKTRADIQQLRTSEDLARLCLPTGHGKTPHGIYRPASADDPIELAKYKLEGNMTKGRLKAGMKRIAGSHEAGRLTDTGVRDLVQRQVPETVREKLMLEDSEQDAGDSSEESL